MTKTMNLSEGPLFKRIITYTVPIILTGILQLLFNAADLVVVGRDSGSLSVAAVGATGSIINLITNVFIGLSVGAGVRTAQSIGAKDDLEVSNTVHTAIPAAFISGIILTVVGFFGAKTFLSWMDTPSDVIDLSTLYMKIYFCGITSTMLYNFGSAILRAAGDTKRPLIYLASSGLLNVALNLFFVKVFHMDVAGVALATAISQTVSAILVLRALIKRDDACRFCFNKITIHVKTLLNIMRIGIPAGIQSSLFSISNVLIQSSINSFGSVVVSGNSAAINIEGFVFTSMNAFHQTALNFTGQNYGAKKMKRIIKILLICLLCVFVTGFTLGMLFYSLSDKLLAIYITDSVKAIEYGMLRMSYICFAYFLCGMMDVTTGMIRGMGSSVTPMIISVLGVCGMRMGWIYFIFSIPRFHTLKSLYLSYPISWLVTFIAQLIGFLIIYKNKKSKLRKI